MRVLTEKSIDFDAKETILFKISKQNSNYLTEKYVELKADRARSNACKHTIALL